jgi:hypothetical protein
MLLVFHHVDMLHHRPQRSHQRSTFHDPLSGDREAVHVDVQHV